MRKRSFLGLGMAGILCMLMSQALLADSVATDPPDTMTIALGKIPHFSDSATEGYYARMLQALDAHAEAFALDIQLMPLERAIRAVQSGRAMAQFPAPYRPAYEKSQSPPGLRYSRFRTNSVVYSVFTQAQAPLLAVDGQEAKALRIVALTPLSRLFPELNLEATTCLPCKIRLVNTRRADGFVFETLSGGRLAEQTPVIQPVRPQFLDKIDARFFVPDNAEGDRAEALLFQALRRAQTDGALAELFAPLQQYYSAHVRFHDGAVADIAVTAAELNEVAASLGMD